MTLLEGEGAGGLDITSALGTLESVTEKATTMITGNTVLMVMLVASLVFIGFRIFKRAKRAARA